MKTPSKTRSRLVGRAKSLVAACLVSIASPLAAQSWLPSSVYPAWANPPSRVISIDYDSSMSETDNGARLKAAIEALTPGDGLSIGSGRWSIVRKLDITLKGTAAKPIWIFAKDANNKPVITRPDANQNCVNIGESSNASYLILRNLEMTGGAYLLRMLTCDHMWIDGCYIHDGKGVGISTQRNCSYIHITNNVVTRPGPGTLGEGMYIGTNSGQYITTWSVIAYNRVYDTMQSRHGDGIELKQGCHHNWVIGNVVYDTPYPNILVYGTGGTGINVVERNLCSRSSNECLQVQGDAIVRDNICMGAGTSAFHSSDHAAPTNNIQVLGNTFISDKDAVTLGQWSGKANMVFANNACYSNTGRGLRFGQRTTGVTVVGNVVYGQTLNVPVGSDLRAGNGLSDFLGASWDGQSIDVRPVTGGPLDGRGVLVHATTHDAWGRARSLPLDIGAAESVASLVADVSSFEVTKGGTQRMTIDAGSMHAGRIYFVIGSLSGSTPGIPLGSYTVPLVPDVWFSFSVANANTGYLQNTIGVLDSSGRGSATLALPPMAAAMRGATFTHAAVLMDGTQFNYVTNATGFSAR